MQRLYETYERCSGASQFESRRLQPIGHTKQQAHIEVVLNGKGEFLRAEILPKEETVIPATESSAGRTSAPVPHGLCDKVQYCAGDYEKHSGAPAKSKESPHDLYVEQLEKWNAFGKNQKVRSVLDYVRRRRLVADLVEAEILKLDEAGYLARKSDAGPPPKIFGVLTANEDRERDQGNALVRWRVEVPGDVVSAVWEDKSVQESWIRFLGSKESNEGLCMVSGRECALAENHPKGLRRPGDGAKLISANDKNGFTYRGRFEDDRQACGVGYETTQKAHNALRWLTERQGYRSADGETYVSWAVSGAEIPNPMTDTAAIFGLDESANEGGAEREYQAGDAGQHFALRLKRAICGYRANLSGTEGVALIGLDSATPGRLAVIYYREFGGEEFFGRLERWHSRTAWFMVGDKGERFIGAPSPFEISRASYGARAEGRTGAKLRKATVERLLPCIVDGRPIPRDLVASAVRAASNRAGLRNPKDKGELDWERALSVACALFRASSEEVFAMALEENLVSRDYLYGRLLAVAENIESYALFLAKQKRDTTAARLMQRFASHPYSTWRNIELALRPYEAQLRTSRPGFLTNQKKLIEQIHNMFDTSDYKNDRQPLSGEFLLGYYCQRAALRRKDGPEAATEEREENLES